MKPLQHLKQLILEDGKKRHPNMPAHAIAVNVWTTAKPEKRELRRICKFIELSGGIANITDSSAVRIDNRKSYVDSVGFNRTIGSVEFRKNPNFKAGHSDISAVWHGAALFIELKRIYSKGKDSQSKLQKVFEESVTQSGGTYVIVHSFEHFYEWATEINFIKPI